MNIKSDYGRGIISTDIVGINNCEMKQMCELKDRIVDVLNSHKPEAKEKKYISDDDLKLMRAILHVFTKEYSNTYSSAFDDAMKELNAPEKKEENAPETPQEQE